jgi:hypothetical protein
LVQWGVPEAAVHIDLYPVLDTQQVLDHAALFLVSIEWRAEAILPGKDGCDRFFDRVFLTSTRDSENRPSSQSSCLFVGATPVADADFVDA